MKIKLKLLLTALALQVFCLGFAATAGVKFPAPHYELSYDISKVETKAIEAYHGECLEIKITLFDGNTVFNDVRGLSQATLFWQALGMGDDYWQSPLGVSTDGTINVQFDSSMDNGAKIYNCFVGMPGITYRAAFQIRMRPSPGAEPSVLPLPVKTLDFEKVHVENAPYYTKAEIDSMLEDFEPSSGGGTGGASSEELEAVKTALSGLESGLQAKANSSDLTALETRVGSVETSASQANTKADSAKLASDRVLAVMTANENVWFEATNYYGMAGIPASMQLYEKRDGQTKLVWDQRNWVRWHVDSALAGKASELTDSLSKWSSFQSFSGEANPLEDTTWISTPRVALSGGFEWQKTTLAKANVFVLHSNGLAAISSPTEGSFFSVEDLDGSPLLTVKKTANQTLPANASAVSVDGQTLIVTYNVASASHPIVNVCLKLEESERVWYAEDDPLCPATVTWSGASGHWVCELTPKYVTNSLFAYAHYTKEGQTLIEMNGVAGASKGFVCSDDPSKIVKIIWNNGNPKFVEVQ